MAKQEANTHLKILNDIRNKQFKPVYFFMGEETYYIDLLTEAIIEHALTDAERDFNQTILYGADTDIGTVINAAKRYPMMAERQLVVVKEAQSLKKLDELSFYLQKPLHTTVLVFNYKYGKLDGRKKVATDIAKAGVLFESKKLYDNQMATWINAYVVSKGYTIEGKAATMLTEFLGNNLSRVAGELDKLILTLPEGEKRITDRLIEQNIGVSKEYNTFELQKALAAKDILKANRIVNYFGKNPKTNPLVMTMSLLFSFFSNLMLCHYAVDKSENGIMRELGFRSTFQTTDYRIAMKNYSAMKTMRIISLFREYDAKYKGFGSMAMPESDLLKELIYKIMHE
ncbi:MAG: DNA polymerase III subunit delta [Candidatus Azobacteroides sp.]|nr:DNA polymerase III subunit delta [Candidatus Azobacteroides sp.]